MDTLQPTCLPGRGVVALRGPDTIGLIQGLVTANVAGLAVGAVTHAALLTPQGKILSAFFAWRTDDGLLLDVSASGLETLLQRLKLYKLRAAVEIEDASGSVGSFVGDEGPEEARPDPRLSALGVRWLGAPAPGDTEAYERRRLDLGVPEFGADYGPSEVFPMDVNLDALGAVDYKKGCFVGQEVVSRMFRKGEVRKRSWIATGGAPLASGASVTADGRPLGTVTSAAGAAGIALIRVDRVAAANGAVEAGGVPVVLASPSYLP